MLVRESKTWNLVTTKWSIVVNLWVKVNEARRLVYPWGEVIDANDTRIGCQLHARGITYHPDSTVSFKKHLFLTAIKLNPVICFYNDDENAADARSEAAAAATGTGDVA
ncbi:hypothetical protein SARC_01846 [Sphaeroforma arctica JP610]|uniref:Uncharacterized protein n=1 Tax=Sphaeroforma arctica JP610 TaxID=667725 RepID=A0A0L0GAS6_9EUKA|nr:hypothetical protein SARC_01846 [Sphaeroforma arctica JP610]KNC86001.1 hypothetical protein SARC_01846 [Sphaeroforma arctica JP610]|eukprot:XP_014159903.1 hypothetical protein SARC_01846 [Sphaeroforma arctica JP610]